MGMEKFFDIKCRYSGLVPSVVVLVATVRASKNAWRRPQGDGRKPVDPAYKEENLPLLRKGLDNLLHHIKIAKKYGIRWWLRSIGSLPIPMLNWNWFARVAIEEGGAFDAVVSNHWEEGGKAQSLWPRQVKASEQKSDFKFLYPLNQTIKEKDRGNRPGNVWRGWGGFFA